MEAHLSGRCGLGPKIGPGSFGEIYMGNDLETKAEVAIKLELVSSTHECLSREVAGYAALARSNVVPQAHLGGRCSLGPNIGPGSFGEIYMGNDVETKAEVAIKLEPVSSTHECLSREVAGYAAFARSNVVPQAHLGGRYSLGPKIGSGSFGEVYMGNDVETKAEVAIKLESVSSTHECLSREVACYAALARSNVVPQVHWHGLAGDYRVLVIDLLGPSLEDLFDYCGRRFSLKTVLLLADQMVGCLELVHEQGLLHRDVKPDNFLLGLGMKADRVHIVDFGLASSYLNPGTRKHRACGSTHGLTGTARYLSLNAHLGIEPSRRDDLESVGHILVYLLRGRLPWQGITARCKQAKRGLIREKMLATSVEQLCEGFPSELAAFMHYCRSLGFKQRPDYGHLRSLLRNLFLRRGFVNDRYFDWTVLAAAGCHACGDSGRRKEAAARASRAECGKERERAHPIAPLDPHLREERCAVEA